MNNQSLNHQTLNDIDKIDANWLKTMSLLARLAPAVGCPAMA
jgi:hypothetical protein